MVDRHTMLSANPGDGLDEYGGFPKNCPNGSGHSIKLGNDDGNGEAEGVSYEFVIPITADKYRLTYQYAVVIQDPGHAVSQQPRMQIEIVNVTDNRILNCSSFSFVADNTLPGFQVSPNPGGPTPVLYKDWSANSVNLDGLQGKTIRFFVKTADCTFQAHFGYAYIDITAECNSVLTGSQYCSGDTAVNVAAPFGYQSYNWYNANFTQLLATTQVLTIQPPPAPGTIVAVELNPFPGYGCRDTLFQKLDTILVEADAGADLQPCNLQPAQLGGVPVSGLLYSWLPTAGLNDPFSPNPFTTVDTRTRYELTVQSRQGGCLSRDSVWVDPQIISQNLTVQGSRAFCLGNPDAAVLRASAVDSVQWFLNDIPIPGANQIDYPVAQSGFFYALMYNNLCADPVASEKIFIRADTAATPIRYPDVSAPWNFSETLQARNIGIDVVWSPAFQLSNAESAQPVFRGLRSQDYQVTLTTETGCVTVDSQLVVAYKKVAIYVPTVFTPNGDGLNDFLRPLLLGFAKVNSFRVYNRWGKLLFASSNDFPGWDGRFQQQIQEPQTVVWTLDAIDVDGKRQQKSGATVLLP
jgi:gliding motility-associated-like protein